jgi:GMP reductase
MSSRVAMDKYSGGVAQYRASEGKEVMVEYRGPVVDTLQEILGGVRSACTYVGARQAQGADQAHDVHPRRPAA